MSQTLSVTEVARHFAEYINRVAYRGECFVLMRGNKPIAELRPLPPPRCDQIAAVVAGVAPAQRETLAAGHSCRTVFRAR